MMLIRPLLLVSAWVGVVGAFSFGPLQKVSQKTNPFVVADEEDMRKVAVSTVAAVWILGSVAASAGPAFAASSYDGPAFANNFGTSEVIAARSGGRSGGRARSMPSRPSSSYARPSPSRAGGGGSTVYRTTIVQPPAPMYMAPPIGYGYGYGSPFGGPGVGLSVLGTAANTLNDFRQESEISRSRQELQEAKMKEAELEARLRALEGAQQQQVAPAPIAPAAP